MNKTNFKQTEIGMIPEDWEAIKGEDCLILEIGSRPKGGVSDVGEIPSLGGEHIDLVSHRIDFQKSPKYISREYFNQMQKGKLKINDILINKDGAYTGKLAFVWELFFPETVINEHLFIIRSNSLLDQKFIFYYLLSNEGEHQIKQNVTGSAQAGLNSQFIKRIMLPKPSLSEQIQISEILSRLDLKINIIQKQNKTLEAIGYSIFKQWFVDFEFPNENGEPYKSSGEEMVDSELGAIPKGWEITNFNAFVNEISNGDWGKASASDNYGKKVYCMRGTDIPEICEGKKGKMPLRYILEKNLNKKVLCTGDLVIEISGGSPTQSTGRTTYINQEILSRYDTKLICSNFCKVIKLINKDYCEYLFLYLRYLYELNIFFNFENGTTGIKNLDIKNLFEKYKIKVPDELTIIKFRKIIIGLFRKIQENGYENNKLSNLRDTLLPKLMSGEIRMPINSKVLISKNN